MKVALITGSSKGLGFAFAKVLAQHGYTIVLHYFSNFTMAKYALTQIKRVAPYSSMVKGDLTKKGECKKIISYTIKKYKRLDVLVNNVGNFVVKPVQDWSEEEFNNVVQSNFSSVFFMMQESFTVMKKGCIVNIGCVSADKITIRKNTTPYYIAKFGVVALTKHFAGLGKSKGIRVNALMPGCLETSVVFPKDVKKSQIVPLSEMTNALLKIINSKQTAQLIDVSRGWIP